MKSTITCDMEGVIETMNDDAEKIFGYKKEELIGKKRVSIFSPGEIVLQNVAGWLDTAVKKGEYIGETYFIKKNGKKINAKIRITPTYKNGKNNPQTGYCGVTEVIEKEVNVPIKFSTKMIKMLAITRMPFTSASLLPIFVIGAYFSSADIGEATISWGLFGLTILGVLIAHLGVNVFNDYFDGKDGTDEANTEYFQQVSGGSRAIELGLISLSGTKKLGIILLLIACIIGGYITYTAHADNLKWIIGIAVSGLFLGYFYTARPLRLVARRGLGELSIFLTFGPLLTLGTALAMYGGDLFSTNTADPAMNHFLNCILLGVPLGLLTTNILLINEFPDMKSDAKTGKNHLVVTFGKKASRWIYLAFLLLATVASSYLYMELTYISLLIPTIFCLLFGLYIFTHILKHYELRSLVDANWKTIGLQALYSMILCACFIDWPATWQWFTSSFGVA
jgi:1,4-dihydroxy-2-naphthoate octaprenyltransferase